MRFIETPVFTRRIVAQLNDDDYSAMQLAMILRPQLGRVIRGSGGLRKLRWPIPGSGKRGGLRVIYFWHVATETFYMLYLYEKNEQEDLTAPQLRVLSRLVREEFE
ncbi:MAG: type II toxin-antitoxin system RelE/ParE family toxin [Gemmataceae bacterium]|nr:type II toxin-antitoxin system RelE/ParE family toxin [Gemmataceae bacterium]